MTELNTVLNQIESLNTPQEKLEFINKKLVEAKKRQGEKGHIKLLSTSEERLIKDFISELTRLKQIYEKRLKYISKPKVNNISIRTKEDYIIWVGEYSILENLINVLLFKKYILDYKQNEVAKLINEHFFVEDSTNIKDYEPRKMRWSKSYPLLIYLFESLYNMKHIKNNSKKYTQVLDSKFWNTRHSIVSKHFTNKKGEPISNDVLARAELQYKKGELDVKPSNYELIDGVLEYAFEES